MGAPVFRVGQEQNLLPILQIGNDLEGFGHLASCEAAHDLPDSMVNFYHLGIEARWNHGQSILPAECVVNKLQFLCNYILSFHLLTSVNDAHHNSGDLVLWLRNDQRWWSMVLHK